MSASTPTTAPLLRVENLSVDFASPNGAVRVVEDLSFHLNAGETLCIAGESGSGKSVTALSLMGLLPKPGGRIATGTALLVAGSGLWLARNRIADGVIADELASLGLPARYTIVSIGPGREVLANVVVGDPRRPDLVIERAELSLAWSLTGPRIGQITLVRPRLYGTLHNGHASFGALDKVIYARPASKTPFRLPDWRLSIVDGRGAFETS